MHNRSELAQIYHTFAQMISTQFSKTIKIFCTNNAMEYKDSQFLDFIHTQGTIIQIPVQEHLSKMLGLNANTVTYLTLLGLSSYLYMLIQNTQYTVYSLCLSVFPSLKLTGLKQCPRKLSSSYNFLDIGHLVHTTNRRKPKKATEF